MKVSFGVTALLEFYKKTLAKIPSVVSLASMFLNSKQDTKTKTSKTMTLRAVNLTVAT